MVGLGGIGEAEGDVGRVIKKDMATCGSIKDMALDRAKWKNKIHVADTK